VGMISWHLLSDPSFPRWFSFGIIQAFNFVAEGFVLLAGAAVGIAWARSHEIRGRRYLRRALELLAVHYVLAGILWFGFSAPDALGDPPRMSGAAAFAAILSLDYQPYLGDILSLFVFLFAATPLLLAFERRFGRSSLMAVSLAIYFAANSLPVLPEPYRRALELNGQGAFDFGSWQLVFVLGILIGAQRERLVSAARRHFRSLLIAALVGFGLMFVYRLGAEKGGPWSHGLPAAFLFERHPLTPPRLLYILLEMLLIALVTIRVWDRIALWRPVQFVETFGRNSLTVYACSVPLDYALKAALHRLAWDFPVNLAAWAFAMALLYLVARYPESRKNDW